MIGDEEDSIKLTKTKKVNGAHNATSRYVKLKENLDNDPLNQNWVKVDTVGNKLKNDAPLTYVDLFAGAGGLSLGFTQAGHNKVKPN